MVAARFSKSEPDQNAIFATPTFRPGLGRDVHINIGVNHVIIA